MNATASNAITSLSWEMIVSCLAALAALGSAICAFLVWKETKRIREAQTEPKVLVTISPSDISAAYLMLEVENAGQTLAKDVHLETSKDVPIDNGLNFSDLGVFNVSFNLAPGQRYNFLAMNTLNIPNLYEIKFTVTVRYFSLNNPQKLIIDSYEFDLKLFKNLHFWRSDWLSEIAGSLKNINDSIAHLVSNNATTNTQNQSGAKGNAAASPHNIRKVKPKTENNK